MFTQRVILRAANGKAGQVRDINTERVRKTQTAGIRASLVTSMLGTAGTFYVNLQFESLTDWYAVRERNAADPDFAAFQQQLVPLLAQPAEFELWEVLVEGIPAATPVTVVQRITSRPLPGEANTMRDLISDRIRQRQAEGIACSLAERIGGQGPAFSVVFPFAAVAEFEARRTSVRSDPASQEYLARLNALQASSSMDLMQVIVPFQPAAPREMAAAATR